MMLVDVDRAAVIAIATVAALVIAVVYPAVGVQSVGPSESGDPHLQALVESYFLTDEAERREALRKRIDELVDGSVAPVIATFSRLDLWPEVAERLGGFPFITEAKDRIRVAYRVPPGYDPSERYPMVLCYSGPQGRSGPGLGFDAFAEVVGQHAKGFVLVTVSRAVGGSFQQAPDEASDLRGLMREVRRRLHVDVDRTFLLGLKEGGDAAWNAALFHSDLFAGVVVVSGYPRLPYPEASYRLLLENSRIVPVVSAWSPDRGIAAPVVAAHNEALHAIAERRSLPFVGVEDYRNSERTVGVFTEELAQLLAGRRPAIIDRVSHRFRYPRQGRADWLRQLRFEGDVWEASQLSILAGASVDRSEFVSSVIESRLAYLGAKVEGQTIVVESRKCGRIELCLPAGLVDLDRPVTVRCNGTRRFRGPVRTSARVVLESAFERWDFQRPAVARLSFSVRSEPK